MARRPCLDCGTPGPGSRCEPCRLVYDNARYAARGTTTERGLGWRHQQQTAQQIRDVPYCQGCGHRGSSDNPLTGEHSTARVHGGTEVDGTFCRRCNSADGARIRSDFLRSSIP